MANISSYFVTMHARRAYSRGGGGGGGGGIYQEKDRSVCKTTSKRHKLTEKRLDLCEKRLDLRKETRSLRRRARTHEGRVLGEGRRKGFDITPQTSQKHRGEVGGSRRDKSCVRTRERGSDQISRNMS